VAVRALDGGVELGAVAERRMRGPRRVHGGRPGSGGSAARIWISPLALRLSGWGGRGIGEEHADEGDAVGGRRGSARLVGRGGPAMGNRARNWGGHIIMIPRGS
jgi:hypothetical protein